MYPSNYRGRPVTETNIQDYVSNIVSKYLPPDMPPWQICVIPMANTTRSDDVVSSSSLSAAECEPSASGSASTSTSATEMVEEPAQQAETDSSAALSVSVGHCVRAPHVLLT